MKSEKNPEISLKNTASLVAIAYFEKEEGVLISDFVQYIDYLNNKTFKFKFSPGWIVLDLATPLPRKKNSEYSERFIDELNRAIQVLFQMLMNNISHKKNNATAYPDKITAIWESTLHQLGEAFAVTKIVHDRNLIRDMSGKAILEIKQKSKRGSAPRVIKQLISLMEKNGIYSRYKLPQEYIDTFNRRRNSNL